MAQPVASALYYDLEGQLGEIQRQLRQQSGYPFDPHALKEYLEAAIEGRFHLGPFGDVTLEQPPSLRPHPLTPEEQLRLILPPTTGQRLITGAQNPFTGGMRIHGGIKHSTFDVSSAPTLSTGIALHAIGRAGTLEEIFHNVPLRFTQDQVIAFGFIFEYEKVLLPFRVGQRDFAAEIHFVNEGGLMVELYPFLNNKGKWCKLDRFLVAVPQSTALS